MKKKKVFVVILVVSTVLLTTFSFYGYQVIRSPNILVDKADEILYIHEEANFDDVRRDLYDQDIIQDAVSFSFIARLMKYPESVKSGRYLLRSNMSNVEAIRMLRAGIQEPTEITFNNVRLVSELSERITENIEMTEVDFQNALEDYVQHNGNGFTDATILGMFIPNTWRRAAVMIGTMCLLPISMSTYVWFTDPTFAEVLGKHPL